MKGPRNGESGRQSPPLVDTRVAGHGIRTGRGEDRTGGNTDHTHTHIHTPYLSICMSPLYIYIYIYIYGGVIPSRGVSE